ncbi:LytTR family DNA-binding domain-containing protein [Dyadobacter chenwenxiniae]|uniref:LytTR family DNA-binding domain-containing protein n=1 Tax=Dyadobacter chenwenxiniae TaxID=2906456 RepID=A0A9X1TH75_9BACT|nr:LytTR family DNA-binding domain-containing protein [Dyadobacter chenwenxiniae]MCF0064450.1 LytTR family DNA-binding domain-containing protein [Dyadobacter chenwenxiniae]UON82347.1 LytTR family DNA-binding domain-containing protein [Dyadobacter chenwenxiniae]
MQKFNCLIVDDEPIARDILKTYCGHLDNLEVIGLCGNALQAKAVMQQIKVDILFLDINMPVMDGIAFLKTLKKQPQVIFTTAYKEHAVDAFDLAACDYLLKPFSLERFIIAVDKALEHLEEPPKIAVEVNNDKATDYIFIKAGDKIYKILHDELLYAEANGNYTKIVTSQKTLLPAMTFSGFEELLPPTLFLRIHRSFIINKAKISHIEGNRVFINGAEIPIGQNYREGFLKSIGL